MDLWEAIRNRHSVRRYLDKPIDTSQKTMLRDEITLCNQQSGLCIQLVTDEPEAFRGFLAHYGKFHGVKNYIALIGKKKDPNLSEKIGYYGERIVLKAQQLGLNTCWVALTYNRKMGRRLTQSDEKIVCVISLGYGENQGNPHKNKPMETLYHAETNPPEWFLRGMEAAMLAPTAVNQQKFLFTLKADGSVQAKQTGGPYADVDLGIVKYHFEVGSGRKLFDI